MGIFKQATIAGIMLISLKSCQCQEKRTDNANEMVGIYEHVYEHNTPDLIENHYINIEAGDGVLSGTYYGTSDDFDSAREGYLPGFFKTNLQEATFQDDILRFKIIVKEEDFFSEPLSPYSKSMPDKKWPQASGIGGERSFLGKWLNGNLVIESSGLPTRIFLKK